MGGLHLRLFGSFQAWREPDEKVPVRSKKGQALLALLALSRDRGYSREKLAALLWGDRPEEQARHSLRQSMLTLRKTLDRGEPPVFLSEGDALALNPDGIRVDVRRFEDLAEAGDPQSLEQAAALYTGDLLEGLSIRAESFETWHAAEQARLRNLACDVLSRLAARYDERDEPARAIEASERLLVLDPVREDGHRRLMRLFAKSGQRARALKQYRICEEVLQRELDAQPANETTSVYTEIRTQQPVSGVVAAAPDAPATPRPHQVGAPLPLPDKPSIAVLPFENLSGDPEQEYFAEGIADDLIAAL